MSALHEWMNKTVLILTSDGRNIIGQLKGFDNNINVVLEKSFERIYSLDQGMVVNELGLHIIRGDNIVIVAEFDSEKDSTIDHDKQRARQIKPVIH